jgi:Zn-dependent M28 family amino/carboxypeptidase
VAYLLRSLATGDRRDPHTGTMTYAADAPKIPAGALSVPDAEQLDRMALRGKPIRLKLLLTPTMREGAYAETVVGEIVGRERPQEVVLIGGHLDSWDLGTGAIDDGAGVAITTAAATLIARLPQHPKRTLRLAMFGAEEIGRAGPAYQQAHAAEELKHVIAAECDFGAEPIYAMELPAGAAESPFGRSLAKLLAPLPASLIAKPAEDGGADMEPLTQVPKAALLQDGTRYFDLHHTADDTLDKVSAAALDKAVAAWVSFAYLVADTDVDFRALAAAKAAEKPAAKP